MKKLLSLIAMAFVLMCAASADAKEQYPVMNMVAGKVIQKYQNSTCEQLWMEKGQQKPPQEQEMIQLLRDDPKMRKAFLDKVAGPITNKMFECGMIP
jgi:hypothetical protein